MTQPKVHLPRPEKWPQFSLQGLLSVVTLAATLTGWGVADYRAREAAEERYWAAVLDNFNRNILPNVKWATPTTTITVPDGTIDIR